MVLPFVVPLILGGATFGAAYGINKLFSIKKCERKYEGGCERECTEDDPEDCIECLYTCGIPEYEFEYYLSLPYTVEAYDRPEYKPRIYYGGRPRHDPRDYRDDRDRYRKGRPWERPKLKGKDKEGGPGMLQDRLDKLAMKHSREHVGGGKADMTADTRGYYGFIVA